MNEEQLQDEIDRLNDLISDNKDEIKSLTEELDSLKDQVKDRDYDLNEIYNISKKY